MMLPGDAPALAEVHITHSGGAAAPIWGLIAWWPKPQLENRVWNGDFDFAALAASGWSIAGVGNITAGATSITRITTASKYPPGSAEVVVPAAVDSGVSFRIFRRFKRGVKYTAECWVQAPTATDGVSMRLGNAAANDKTIGSNLNLATTWQRLTVEWTPSADRDDAHVGINHNPAVGATFRIDGVMVYEGTTAPTSENQSFGRGGYPPVGIIEAEADDGAPDPVVANANYRSGFGKRITASANTVLRTDVIVDPALLLSDDFTQDQIAIEVWGRVELDAAKPATALLSAYALTGALGLEAQSRRYSLEYGSAGKALVMPSTGVVFRFVRLGTLLLSTTLGRYRLGVQLLLSGASGTAGIDYLVLIPASARALSPTGKADDDDYPDFIASTSEITKIIHSDLSATIADEALGAVEIPTAGLGGSLIEVPSGVDLEWLVKLSNLVPDDPSSNTATEQLSHSATVHIAVVPRVHLARSE